MTTTPDHPLMAAPGYQTTTALPDWIGEHLDLEDPDLWAILEAVDAMTAVGHDATTPAGLQVCVDAGHRRVRLLAEHLTPERVAEQRAKSLDAAARRDADREARAQVYYARHGGFVKIGYSFDVARRVQGFGCQDLLAVEPGGLERERQRHHEFRELRDHGEWFRLEQPLIGHIAALREQATPPRVLPGKGAATRGARAVDPTGRMITVEQATARYGVPASTIYTWISRPWVPVWWHDGLLDPDEIAARTLARR